MQTRLRSGWRASVGSTLLSAARFSVSRFAFPRDSYAAVLVAASLLAIAGLLAYVDVSLPTLPPLLPLHYDGSGSVDLIGPRADLFRIPAIGAVVFVADLVLGAFVYRQDRWAALALLAMSGLVQVMLIVATINIIRLAFGD